jgi:SAM-dependent methyltransferase
MVVLYKLDDVPPADLSVSQHSQFTEPDRYYEAVKNNPPHKTLEIAIQLFKSVGKESGTAVDIGSGGGRDTLFLLNHGWQVVAIDKESTAFNYLTNQLKDAQDCFLTKVQTRMEDAVIPEADLVNAGLSLPFCQPNCFSQLWRRISAAIKVNGRFAGHFFGERDSWASNPMQTHVTQALLTNLFKDFAIEYLKEVEDDCPTALGEAKHWHVFHIVARKLPGVTI